VENTLPEVSSKDLTALEAQLGRVPRGVVEIAARCKCGDPLVVKTAPRLPDGTPFPTTYYLTHPALTTAISRLEADGVMRELNERLETEPGLAMAYRQAHEAFLADREELAASLQLDVPEIDGISAGGMPTRVKCLHAHAGHSLAAGQGVNPIGDLALEMIGFSTDACAC
jgi:hypothetical protein